MEGCRRRGGLLKKIARCAQNKIVLKQYIGAKNDTKQYKTIQKDTKSCDTFLQKYAI